MTVRFNHAPENNSLYFLTFTCFKWLPLFEKTISYDLICKWFDHLHENKIYVTGYVIMPNHIHSLLHFPIMSKPLNVIIGNAKRFMAYELIKRLKRQNECTTLDLLHYAVKKRESDKGQIHKVFEDSFDATECYNEKVIYQKLHYMHHNPVSKKWNLVKDFTDYKHSSASFYEKGIKHYSKLVHVNDVIR
jgi:REP element-mobilizing transposase RayT